jgi:hypothetical protein
MNKYSEIIINQLASSTQEEQYLLCCNGQYYEANLSVVELVKEIVLFRLLTGQRIRNLQQYDQVFYNTLRQHLLALSPSPTDGPADYARYGYIARWRSGGR